MTTFLSDGEVSKAPEGRRVRTGSWSASGTLNAAFGGGSGGENRDWSFWSTAGPGGSLFVLTVGGSGVPTGGSTMSGRVNGGGGEPGGFRGTSSSGVVEGLGAGFGIPEWMVDR